MPQKKRIKKRTPAGRSRVGKSKKGSARTRRNTGTARKPISPGAPRALREGKPIGKITHYFGKIKVMIVRFSVPISLGTTIRVKGATTNFVQTVASMQFDHKSVARAKKRQEVGIKAAKRVREGDSVYRV